MQAISVYSRQDSPRLRYVLKWVLEERLGLDVQHTAISEGEPVPGPGIAYGIDAPGALFIPDSGVLAGTNSYLVDPADWDLRDGDGPFARFDLFAAVFFLLSRMEEWESIAEDVHGRYLHSESVLYKAGLLQTPVVDIWVEALRVSLEKALGVSIPQKAFTWQPTYDIDMAWAYRHKGLLRNGGAAFRDLLRGRWGAAVQRLTTVLTPRKPDPHDSFKRLHGLHQAHTLEPRWFILAAKKPSRFDKNASLQLPRMRALIKSLAANGQIGLHPSYYSGGDEVRFAEEKEALEALTGAPVTHSRQHFLRFSIRHTPRFLLHHGITDDYTMGYAGTLGFRAGTGHSFSWYDMEAEKETGLRLHPFAFMDSAAHFYEKLPAADAISQLEAMARQLQATGSTLQTVFHNYSLGTDRAWPGWWEGYAGFAGKVDTLIGR